jgi:hypothetical protein
MPRHAKILKISSFHVSPYLAHSLWISMRRFCKGGRTRAKLQAIRRLQRHCGSRKSPVPKAWDSVVRCGPWWGDENPASYCILVWPKTWSFLSGSPYAMVSHGSLFSLCRYDMDVDISQCFISHLWLPAFACANVVNVLYLFVCVPGFEAVAPGLQQLGPDHRLHQSIRSFSLTTRNDDHPAM